jgi:asparagine synthase (glutamine-hydrolysing)
MCGLAGIFDVVGGQPLDNLRKAGQRMTATLVHRGPDDSGLWADEAGGILLGFRRLSILDLSPAGHQPMESASGRYVIVCNGEVYNFAALRQELEKICNELRFRGHSDTEVILTAIETWGVEEAVKRFIGMFAFALWDRRDRRLHLVRDRVGVKPLYYGWVGDTLLFASELKALCAYPDFRGTIDRDALALLMRYGYIPSPYCIYKHVYKLTPGTILTFASGQTAAVPKSYWSPKGIVEQAAAEPFTGSLAEATERLDVLLRDAVRLRMIADVPLGAFLSGGIDSSTVVALMQALSQRPVRTFSIGFNEQGYNEAQYANAVARHLGTEHTELYVTPEEALAVIPKLPTLYDEPLADSSQIPTYLVSALARRDVTVALSGDGGDELFGGYDRYFWGQKVWKRIRLVPRSVRRCASHALAALSPQIWDTVFRRTECLLPRRSRISNPGTKATKLAAIFRSESPEMLHRTMVSAWNEPCSIILGAREAPTTATTPDSWAGLTHCAERMMSLDLMTYLPEDILAKVDRASMGVALEARQPLLDHRLVKFAWSLPLSYKIRGQEGKVVLREVLSRYVPRQLTKRPKAGFCIPLDHWLRLPLRDWAESLLDERRLAREGFFHPSPIRKRWEEHLFGRRDHQGELWTVLMFQAWLDRWGRPGAAETAIDQAKVA